MTLKIRLGEMIKNQTPKILARLRTPQIDIQLGKFVIGQNAPHHDRKSVSFCTTYRNRFEQITATLPENLEHNRSDSDRIEFVIVQFGGKDDLHPWLLKHYSSHLESGYIRFFQSDKMPDWHMCIAKNTAHRLASGSIVTNLDCDNYTGVNGGRHVIDTLANATRPSILWQWTGRRGDGTLGRISLTKDLFLALGGYDEKLGASQWHDRDLVMRASSQRIRVIAEGNENYSRAIQHPRGLGYNENLAEITRLIKANRNRSYINLLRGEIIANMSREIGVSVQIPE